MKNQQQELLFAISDIIKTKEDKLYFLMQLRTVSQAFFSHEKDILSLFEQYMPYSKKEKLLSLAQKFHITLQDEQACTSFLASITTCLAQIDEVTLTLGFEPTEAVIDIVLKWFQVHMKKAVILDIVIDTSLIGGIIIGYKGLYKDFSLKKKIQEKYKKGELHLSALLHE